MDKDEVIYWINLEIPIEDFLEEEKVNKTTFTRKIFNRLKNKYPNWLKVLSITSNDPIEQVTKFRQDYDRNHLPALRAYCCCWFAHKADNLPLFTSFSTSKLNRNQWSDYEDEDEILCFLLYNRNKNNLVDIYYENFLQRIQTDTYLSNVATPYNHNVNLNNNIAQSILDKYERKKKIKKQKSKIWWFKDDQISWTIIFRRSRLKGVPIKLLKSNKFVRTADLKAFKIEKNFLTSHLYTKKEASTMIKCIEFFAKELANLQVIYNKQERIHPNNKVVDFINKSENKTNGIIILEIAFRNFPLNDSPTLIIRSQDDGGIHNSLNQLRDEGKSPNNEDCVYMRVKKDNKKFDIKFNKLGPETGISLNYRGLSPVDKQEVLTFLDNEFR